MSRKNVIDGPPDLLVASASDIQERLTAGSLSSEYLVRQCLSQIERYDRKDPNLRAMIAISPKDKLVDHAKALDEERREGRARGPLHGIPIIVKV